MKKASEQHIKDLILGLQRLILHYKGTTSSSQLSIENTKVQKCLCTLLK